MNSVCIEEDCQAPSVALFVVVVGDLLGRPVAATVYPLTAPFGGGQPVCAEHLHGLIDEVLMTAQPPPTPPAVETL